MKTTITLLLTSFLLSSCIFNEVREQMDKGLQTGMETLADNYFKSAISHIELHKLRNGNYPASLKQIKYMSLMDSVLFDYVEYEKLDSGYALDLTSTAPSLSGERQQQIVLHYPEDFWNGLGCLRSNVK